MATKDLQYSKEIEFQLQAQRVIVLQSIRTHLHQSDNPDHVALANHQQDFNDWAEADLYNDIDLAILNHELSELRALDAALLRLKNGEYGVCVDCGNLIPHTRLTANLTALRCIHCQTRADQRNGATHYASI
jgi:DnaK suppressor protein